MTAVASRTYICDTCGVQGKWGGGWRWRSADEYRNGLLRVIFTCSDDCRNIAGIPLINIKEFALRRGAHANTIWAAIRSDRIPARMVGGKWFIRADVPFEVRRAAEKRGEK